jgi:ribosomal protein S18 acetylase RimI-like enzyme
VTRSHLRLSSDLPIPMLNSAFAVRFAHPADVADTVRELGPHSVLWWLGPSARPADAGRLLERCGLHRIETLTLMTIDLWDVPPAESAGDGLRVQAVRTPAALRAWAHVHARARGSTAAVEAAWVAVLSSLGTEPHALLQHYLFSGDGQEPLASASIFLDGRWAGLYSLGTVPLARGRGLGTAVTLFALADARARGYRTAMLGAEPAAAGLYHRLGFIDRGQLAVYG